MQIFYWKTYFYLFMVYRLKFNDVDKFKTVINFYLPSQII